METEATAPVNPWDRGIKESDEAYAAFTLYREMGNARSLVKVAQEVGKSTTLIERWSQRDEWRHRVVAWDRYAARVINERILTGTAAMRERMVNSALALQSRAVSRLTQMTEAEIAALSPAQVVSLMKTAADIEFKARDLSPHELESWDRQDNPTFHIRFIEKTPEEMVPVRMKNGQTGFIPKARLEEFQADYPDASVIQ